MRPNAQAVDFRKSYRSCWLFRCHAFSRVIGRPCLALIRQPSQSVGRTADTPPVSRVLVPGRGFYIWGGYANLGNYPPYLRKRELYFSQGIVWDKQHPVLTRKDRMGSRVERVSFAWERGKVVKG